MRSDYEQELCKLFGKNLARVRQDRHWSQERLALETGLARSYVGDVERGLRNISLVNICKFADALGVDVSVLAAFRNRHEGQTRPDDSFYGEVDSTNEN